MLSPLEELRSYHDEPEGAEVPANVNALEMLQAIYRSPKLPLMTRMRAAAMALPFESPKLMATATVDLGQDFAARLERAILRSHGPKVIEAKAAEPKPVLDPPPVKPHLPTVPDRRYRRF
jgi:hypothetical protein